MSARSAFAMKVEEFSLSVILLLCLSVLVSECCTGQSVQVYAQIPKGKQYIYYNNYYASNPICSYSSSAQGYDLDFGVFYGNTLNSFFQDYNPHYEAFQFNSTVSGYCAVLIACPEHLCSFVFSLNAYAGGSSHYQCITSNVSCSSSTGSYTLYEPKNTVRIRSSFYYQDAF